MTLSGLDKYFKKTNLPQILPAHNQTIALRQYLIFSFQPTSSSKPMSFF